LEYAIFGDDQRGPHTPGTAEKEVQTLITKLPMAIPSPEGLTVAGRDSIFNPAPPQKLPKEMSPADYIAAINSINQAVQRTMVGEMRVISDPRDLYAR
jgi:hypothetical protein